MRTVHETEALRPSDPIPKHMQDIPRPGPVVPKIIMKPYPNTNPLAGALISPAVDPSNLATSYPPELGFTLEEEAKGPVELWRLLRKQIQWVEEEGAELRKQCEMFEELRKKEWMEKELLVTQYEAREREIAQKKTRARKERAAKERLGKTSNVPREKGVLVKDEAAISPSMHGTGLTPNTAMSPNGGTPFSPRDLTPLDQGPVETDAAEVLASIAHT